jgi:Metallo-peptidase family M12/Fibronectin type III domain/Secretion system C-terminal sorting domain
MKFINTFSLLPLSLALICATDGLSQQTASGPMRAVASRVATVKAQTGDFVRHAPLGRSANSGQKALQLANVLENAEFLTVRPTALEVLSQQPPDRLELVLSEEGQGLSLDLLRVDPFTADFRVVAASNGLPVAVHAGVHYRGVVKGDMNTLAAISIFPDELMGFVSDATGNRVLGRLEGSLTDHVLYRDTELKAEPGYACATEDDGEPYAPEQLTGAPKSAKCVRLFWEVHDNIFANKGSMQATVNYMSGLFNQSATLYENDDITVVLSEMLVWDVASPYTGTSTNSLLNQFQNNRNTFNGDLAHLIGLKGNGGIADGTNGFCRTNLDNSMCYSGIKSTYSTVPTYSWSVNVVTHEQGHLMGSKHTHACVWNGNNTAIDKCGPNAGYSEGNCYTNAPIPSGGGTIMSYCHLVSAGINFNNGFGSQPTSAILSDIGAATCLTNCSGASCASPAGVSATGITGNSAAVSWNVVPNALSYTVRHRPVGSGVWESTTGLPGFGLALTGLSSGTDYEVQVQANCSGGDGEFSASTLFSTFPPGGCEDTFESNNTSGSAKVVPANNSTLAKIGSNGDLDWFKFANTNSQRNIKVQLTDLPANYDVELRRGSTLLATSTNAGNASESVIYNTSTVSSNYKVKVSGVGGAFNGELCYTLTIELGSGAFNSTNEGGIADGVHVSSGSVTLYPNPARDLVTLVLPASGTEASVVIYDATGRTVHSQSQAPTDVEVRVLLSMAQEPDGLYFVRSVVNGQGSVQRFVVQR